MATVIISNLPPAPPLTGTGSSQGTDLFPATDVTDKSSAPTGTTKKYTLSEIYNWMLSAAGLTTYAAVRVATTDALSAVYDNGASGVGATLTNSGTLAALVIDGVTLIAADRVLVKNQVSDFQNGIYVVTNTGSVSTNWILTRATDYDTSSEVVYHGVVLINQGDTYAGLLYQEIEQGPFIIGTSPINFAQFTSQSISFPVLLSQGGTSASLTASNGGIFYSTATTGAILSGTATPGKVLQSGANDAPSWSTPTYPSASGSAGQILRSDGTNNVYTTATFANTYSASSLLYSNGANTVTGLATAIDGVLITSHVGVPSILANSGTPGFVLTANSGAPPSWQSASASGSITVINGNTGTATPTAGAVTINGGTTGLTTSGSGSTLSLTGTLGLGNGGTNAALTASNGGIFYSTATAGAILAGTATASQLLMSGSSSAPSWSTSTYPSTNAVNTLLYASGANTMAALATANSGMLTTNGSGVPAISTLAAGQIFIGTTGSAPTAAAINSGTGIIVANGSGSITVNATGGGLATVNIAGTAQAAAVNTRYIVTNAAQTTITLPLTFAIGDVVVIKGLGAAGWILAAGTGKVINAGQTPTSSGGSLTSQANFDVVQVSGLVANTSWSVDYMQTAGFTVA